jgi:hypothetical protein
VPSQREEKFRTVRPQIISIMYCTVYGSVMG